MAITYPITLPTAPAFRSLHFAPRAVVAVSASEFTATEQVQAHQGEHWTVDCVLPPMQRGEAEAWIAALLSLNGRQGTFLLGDQYGATPRGSVPGTPQVDGAGQTGRSLDTKGWTAGQTGILLAGDYLQIGSGSTQRLYRVVQDADSDGSGLATLEIWPRLRESPSDSAGITTSACKGLFRLAANQMEWSIDEAAFYGLGFGAVEALPVT